MGSVVSLCGLLGRVHGGTEGPGKGRTGNEGGSGGIAELAAEALRVGQLFEFRFWGRAADAAFEKASDGFGQLGGLYSTGVGVLVDEKRGNCARKGEVGLGKGTGGIGTLDAGQRDRSEEIQRIVHGDIENVGRGGEVEMKFPKGAVRLPEACKDTGEIVGMDDDRGSVGKIGKSGSGGGERQLRGSSFLSDRGVERDR